MTRNRSYCHKESLPFRKEFTAITGEGGAGKRELPFSLRLACDVMCAFLPDPYVTSVRIQRKHTSGSPSEKGGGVRGCRPCPPSSPLTPSRSHRLPAQGDLSVPSLRGRQESPLQLRRRNVHRLRGPGGPVGNTCSQEANDRCVFEILISLTSAPWSLKPSASRLSEKQ